MTNSVDQYIFGRTEARAYGEVRWQVVGPCHEGLLGWTEEQIPPDIMWIQTELSVQIKGQIGPSDWYLGPAYDFNFLESQRGR